MLTREMEGKENIRVIEMVCSGYIIVLETLCMLLMAQFVFGCKFDIQLLTLFQLETGLLLIKLSRNQP